MKTMKASRRIAFIVLAMLPVLGLFGGGIPFLAPAPFSALVLLVSGFALFGYQQADAETERSFEAADTD